MSRFTAILCLFAQIGKNISLRRDKLQSAFQPYTVQNSGRSDVGTLAGLKWENSSFESVGMFGMGDSDTSFWCVLTSEYVLSSWYSDTEADTS